MRPDAGAAQTWLMRAAASAVTVSNVIAGEGGAALMWTARGVGRPDAGWNTGATTLLGGLGRRDLFFFFFITLGLELSDTKVYEP